MENLPSGNLTWPSEGLLSIYCISLGKFQNPSLLAKCLPCRVSRRGTGFEGADCHPSCGVFELSLRNPTNLRTSICFSSMSPKLGTHFMVFPWFLGNPLNHRYCREAPWQQIGLVVFRAPWVISMCPRGLQLKSKIQGED